MCVPLSTDELEEIADRVADRVSDKITPRFDDRYRKIDDCNDTQQEVNDEINEIRTDGKIARTELNNIKKLLWAVVSTGVAQLVIEILSNIGG